MKLTEQQIKQRDNACTYILGRFDFKNVQLCMRLLDWKWHDKGALQVPTEGQLYRTADRLLVQMYEQAVVFGKDCSIETGGLRAEAFVHPEVYPDHIALELSFILEHKGF